MVCEYIQNCMKFSIKLVFTKFFTLEAEAGESLEFEAKRVWLQRKFQDSQTFSPFSKNQTKKLFFKREIRGREK